MTRIALRQSAAAVLSGLVLALSTPAEAEKGAPMPGAKDKFTHVAALDPAMLLGVRIEQAFRPLSSRYESEGKNDVQMILKITDPGTAEDGNTRLRRTLDLVQKSGKAHAYGTADDAPDGQRTEYGVLVRPDHSMMVVAREGRAGRFQTVMVKEISADGVVKDVTAANSGLHEFGLSNSNGGSLPLEPRQTDQRAPGRSGSGPGPAFGG